MADKNIDIQIKTTADTKGAEQAEAAIDALNKTVEDTPAVEVPLEVTGVEEAEETIEDLKQSGGEEAEVEIPVSTPGAEEAKQAIEDLKDTAEEIPAVEVPVTTPGAEEGQRAIDDLNKTVATVDESPVTIPVAAPGAKEAAAGAGQVAGAVRDIGKAKEELSSEGAEWVAEQKRQMQELFDSARGVSEEMTDAAVEENQAQQVTSINRKVTAQVIAQLGQFSREAAGRVRELADELREYDPSMAQNVENVAKGFDLVGQAANGAALGQAFGGAYGAAIGATVGPALGLAMQEVQAAMISQAALNKLLSESPIIANRIAEVKRLMDMRAEAASWEDLTDKMKEAADSAKFASEILAARYEAEEAIARADVTIARATGGDVEAAEENLARVQAAAARTQDANKLRIALRTAEIAEREVEVAEKKIAALKEQRAKASADNAKKLGDEITKLEAQLEPLRDKFRQANTEVTRLEITNPLAQKTRDRETTATDIQGGQQKAVESIQTVIDEAEATGAAGPDLQAVMDSLKKALADGSVSQEDLRQVELFLAQWRAALLNLGVLPETFEKAVDAVGDLNDRMKKVEGKLPDTSGDDRGISGAPSSADQRPSGFTPAGPGLPPGMTPAGSGQLPPGMAPGAGSGLPPGMTPSGAGQLPPGMTTGTGSRLPPGMSAAPKADAALDEMKGAVIEGAEQTRKIGEIAGGMQTMVSNLKGLDKIPNLMHEFVDGLDGIIRRVEALEIKARQ